MSGTIELLPSKAAIEKPVSCILPPVPQGVSTRVQQTGFFRFYQRSRQGASAHGPNWAAPIYIDWQSANRMRTTDACVPDLVEVLEQEWRDCDNALAPIPMNRPSMALGDRNDRRASILEQ